MRLFIQEQSETAERARLAQSLEDFYQSTSDYTAFHGVTVHRDPWEEVARVVGQVLSKKSECSILEVGAGRSGFGSFVRERFGEAVRYRAQDVTSQNEEFLLTQTPLVSIGDMRNIREHFDVIFHTYVFEHLCYPREHLEWAFDALHAEGALLIFSPRYDVPFYLPPAFDHLHPIERLRAGLYIMFSRARTIIRQRATFLILKDPAVLHLPFHRDRDAIHLVSKYDVRSFFRNRAELEFLSLDQVSGLKQKFVRKYLTLAVVIRKTRSR